MLIKKKLMELPVLMGVGTGLKADAEVINISGSNILHIDVTDEKELIVRYFADKDKSNWICWGRSAGWNQMGLSSAIDFELSRGDYLGYSWGNRRLYRINGEPYFGSITRIVQEYLGDVCYYIAAAMHMIDSWEMLCRSDKREQYIANHHNKIDAVMSRVPDLPEGFRNWLDIELFNVDYLYTKKAGKKTEYICTACGKKGARQMKARLGQQVACPRCGKTVTVRSMTRKYKPQKANVVVLQTLKLPMEKRDSLYGILSEKTAWVERQLTVECRALAGSRDYVIYEDLRAVIPKNETWGKVYYGEYSNGTVESQMFWDKNQMSKRWKISYLYPDNLPEVLKVAGMEHSGLDILARKKIPINVDYFIIKWEGRKWIEYLIKGGLFRLVQDVTNGGVWTGVLGVDGSGRNMQECLGLDGGGVARMKQADGGLAMLKWLRKEKKTGKKISMENIEFFNENRVTPDERGITEMMQCFGSANKVANYLRRQMEKTGNAASTVLDTWLDYMDMAKRLNKQVKNEMVYKPKDVRLAHDECLALLKREDAVKRAGEIRMKFPEAEEIMQIAAGKYEFENETYMIRIPRSIEEIIIEGATLGHCIDRTDIYFERIQNRTSMLVFLRKKERPEAPWYTLEIEPGGTVRQKRTVGNTQKDSDVKAFTPFLREWQKHILRKMNEDDRKLAMASKEARLEEYGELRRKQELVRSGILRGQLLADVLEKDLMEAI